MQICRNIQSNKYIFRNVSILFNLKNNNILIIKINEIKILNFYLFI